MPRSATLKNLYVHLTAAPAGAATDGNDVAVADYITVAAGDLVPVKSTQAGGPANANAMVSFEISY